MHLRLFSGSKAYTGVSVYQIEIQLEVQTTISFIQSNDFDQ